MTQLLDARTSQNASYANSIAIPILIVDSPALVGQVGLNVHNASGITRVIFNGTVAMQLPLLPVVTAVTLTVVRGFLPTDPLVYSATEILDLEILGSQVLTITGSDYNVPFPISNQLVYTMFISASALGTVRVGPESFNAVAYSD